VRQRGNLVRYAAAHIQHMQKALAQMNLQLSHVIKDISGVTGMRIVRAIVAGERNPVTLARLRDPRCKSSESTIARALHGNWRREHLFSLKQALELYDVYQAQVAACDREILEQLARFDGSDASGGGPPVDLNEALQRISGADLTAIDGIDTLNALKIIAEVGTDMSRWRSAKHFASWLGLCPGTKISGGKRLSTKTKRIVNRAAVALRTSAVSLKRSKSALGAYLRRQWARLGGAKAVTATAHKLARLVYSMLKHGTSYVDLGQNYYEERYRDRVIKNLKRKAQALGYQLVGTAEQPAST